MPANHWQRCATTSIIKDERSPGDHPYGPSEIFLKITGEELLSAMKGAHAGAGDAYTSADGAERSTAWLVRLLWEQEVECSNHSAPTTFIFRDDGAA